MQSGGFLSGRGQRALLVTSIWLSVFAGLPGLHGLIAADETGIEDYKLASGLYQKGRWKLAAESYETFLKQNPRHRKAEDAQYYLGLTYINLENHTRAREVLRQFLKTYKDSKYQVRALYWTGQSSYILEDYPAAEQELAAFVKQVNTDEPLLERAWPYLAESEFRLNKPREALQNYQKALKAFPDGVLAEESRFGAAQAFEKLQRPAEAIAIYKQLAANRKGRRGADALSNLGARYFEEGKFADAATAYSDLEKNYPASPLVPLARLNLGFALYRQGNFANAVAQFDRAAASEKQAAEATLWKGLSLKAQGQVKQSAEHFAAAYEKFKNDPLAPSLLFQQADSEQHAGNSAEAVKLFLSVADNYPKTPFADEAVQAAILAAITGNDLPEAEKLLARFDRDFPNNRFRLRQELLKGRLALAKGDAAGAQKRFEEVLKQSTIEQTKLEARLYAAHAAQIQNKHAEAMTLSEPLVAALARDAHSPELWGALVLRGTSMLALGKATSTKTAPKERLAHFQNATQAGQKYLEKFPRGPLADQALVIVILGSAHSGQKIPAVAGLQKLRQEYPTTAEIDRTLLELAELALGNEDGAWATTLFGELATRPAGTRYRERGLSGLGWSQYKLKNYTAAAETFAKLAEEKPLDPVLVADAGFMRGKALQLAGKAADAQLAYAEAFRKFGTADSAFLAGLQSARLLGQLGKADESDAAFTALFERFPKPNQGDRILDEWAAMNYGVGKFARSDEVFRRIIRDFPTSTLVDNARLSLAESDLVSGKVDAAKAAFTTLSTSAQSDPEVQQQALYQLMHIERQAGKWDELRKVCRDSLTRFPAGLHRWDAEFHQAEADFQQPELAKETRDRLLKLLDTKTAAEARKKEWFPRVWVMLAESYFRLKEYPAVMNTAESFRNWDAKSPLLYQVEEVVGRAFKAQAKFKEARDAFRRVVQNETGAATETAARSQFQIAETFVMQKDYKQAALEYLRLDIEEYKGYPAWQAPALFQAGMCHETLQDWKEARADYENLISRFPRSEFTVKARDRLAEIRNKTSS